MPSPSRLSGRFFIVLISLIFAVIAPRNAAALNPASFALYTATPHFTAWPSARRFTLAETFLAPPASGMDSGGGLTLCQIADTVYRADGTPAQGTLVILWNAFTTADGQPVAAGSLSVDLGPNGQFNAGLAPNTGASPAGTYYRVTYKLNDGTTTSEYWVVPESSTTTIGAIRSKLVPANMAAQFLTRDFADSHYMDLSDPQTVAGAKTFIASPTIPTPVNPTDAATKAYVDANQGTANLASPPPIGNVTPNTGNFTTLNVQNTNGIPNPANYPQSDPCAQINAAIGALPAAGGTVDARAFAPGQTCNATLNAIKPVNLLFGAGTWIFNGNPGINISAPNVTLECPASTILQASPTTLQSGIAAPLIANFAVALVNNGHYHTADGTQIFNCQLNGASTGTFGIFAPAVYTMKLRGVHASNFTGADILVLGAQIDMYNTVADGSRGDGIVWGCDGHVSGMSQANGNLADGWHVFCGSSVFDGPTGYENGLYGMHFDGVPAPDWTASKIYVEPKIILPTSNNAGAYLYYSQQVGTTAASRPAQFCQSVGCVTRDGTVLWINVGNGNVYGLGAIEPYGGGINLNAPNISASNYGNHPGDWDDIFFEGAPTQYSKQNSILGAKLNQAAVPAYPAHGVHLKFVVATSLKDIQWYGGAWNPPVTAQPDLGGLELENTSLIQVDDLNCSQSYGPCLGVAGSNDILVSKIVSANGGVAASTASYIAQIDPNSAVVLLDHVEATDSRTPPYQRGIVNSGSHVVAKNEKYQNMAAGDSGVQVSEAIGLSDSLFYNIPTASGYQWGVGGTAVAGFNGLGIEWFSSASAANNINVSAPTANFSAYQMTWPSTPGVTGQCLTSSGGGSSPMTWTSCSSATLGSPPPIGNVAPNTVNATALTYQNIPGVQFLVSRYTGIQAAINAAAGSGQVTGVVIDDRTSAYTGAGFNIPDSVTVQLAPVTYTISSTTTFNNGNNNVTAGIILQPGARLLGSGTSTNHGTILQPANGLNADLIATSTVGTGTTNPQWWHWGEIGNLRLIGNGSNQTAGDCLKVENMGETARIHDLELSACYLNNFENIGYAATQSAITNLTSNRAVTGAGVAFTNLGGVGVLNGFSGDCNQVALIAANFNAAGTLQITGLKSEAESTICPAQVQDPVILVTTTSSTVIGSVSVNGGYAFGTTQQNFVKSTGPGSLAFTMQNFYLLGYTNILNDTVRAQVIANTATTAKQPVSYLGNGVVLGNQAFTLQGNTFIQGNPNGTPTELFGLTSSSATLLADAGNGDNSSVLAGGIQIDGHNRAQYGTSPEIMARWGYRFLGQNNGYDTTKWDLVPAWNAGDTTEKNLGNPLTVCQKGGTLSCRWSNLYAQNIDTTSFTLNGNPLATVATSGSYNDLSNKPTIPVQGAHLVSGTMQGATSTLTGNSTDQTIYTATIPAGSFTVGTGVRCYAKWTHPTASGSITYKWTLGATTWGYAGYTSTSQNLSSDIEILTIASLSAQSVNLSPVIAGTAIGIGGSYGNVGTENLANADTLKLTFNGGSSDQIKGATFYCQTIQ